MLISVGLAIVPATGAIELIGEVAHYGRITHALTETATRT